MHLNQYYVGTQSGDGIQFNKLYTARQRVSLLSNAGNNPQVVMQSAESGGRCQFPATS